MAEAVADAFRYSKLVLATTTYNATIFPHMQSFIDHLTARNYQGRTVGMIENGAWGAYGGKGHEKDAGNEQEPHLHGYHRHRKVRLERCLPRPD